MTNQPSRSYARLYFGRRASMSSMPPAQSGYYAIKQGTPIMSEQQTIVSKSVPPTTLVVDDEPAITKLCKALLRQAGFNVLDATGSVRVLCYQTGHPYHVRTADHRVEIGAPDHPSGR